MLDAYVMEKQAVGTWVEIGYTAPGTTPAAANGTSAASNVIAYAGSTTGTTTAVWTATPRSDLNDCTTSMSWSLTGTASGTNVGYSNTTAATSAACTALTPSWSNLTRATN